MSAQQVFDKDDGLREVQWLAAFLKKEIQFLRGEDLESITSERNAKGGKTADEHIITHTKKLIVESESYLLS